MPERYSLRDVVTDGYVTAPRWLQHTLKILTHTSVAYVLLMLTGRTVLSAMLGGPALFVLLIAKERVHPTDPQPLTFWQHLADWLTDFSLACLPVAAAFVGIGDRIAGVLLFGAIVSMYAACHREARP